MSIRCMHRKTAPAGGVGVTVQWGWGTVRRGWGCSTGSDVVAIEGDDKLMPGGEMKQGDLRAEIVQIRLRVEGPHALHAPPLAGSLVPHHRDRSVSPFSHHIPRTRLAPPVVLVQLKPRHLPPYPFCRGSLRQMLPVSQHNLPPFCAEYRLGEQTDGRRELTRGARTWHRGGPLLRGFLAFGLFSLWRPTILGC